MHLHRGFGDADIVGDLLVPATGDDMEHDVALAGAERIETFPERGQCPFTLPTGTIASEAGLNGVKQILITERLCEELYRTALHCLHSHRYIGVRCHEDDRYLPVCSSKLALKLKAASPRHSHVEYQASRPLWRIGLEKVGNGAKFQSMQADFRNSRVTESRNSGSSSITRTQGFAPPILGILRGEAHFSPISASFYAQSVEMNRDPFA